MNAPRRVCEKDIYVEKNVVLKKKYMKKYEKKRIIIIIIQNW